MDITEPTSITQFTVYGALVVSQAYMIKYFIDELRRERDSYRASINALVTEFRESLKEVAGESKDGFNKLATAIDDLREKFDTR